MISFAASVRMTLPGLVLSTLALTARAEEIKPDSTANACIQAYEQVQSDRRAGELRVARAQAILCAADRCPKALSRDCARWIVEIETSLPTLVLQARDDSEGELTAVRVSIDGSPLVAGLDGKAVFVDPGPHTLRFVNADGTVVESKIVVLEGEKSRKVAALFTRERRLRLSPLRRAAWVAAGLSAAQLGGALAFGVLGNSKRAELDRAKCAPRCNPADVDSISRSYAISDLLLGGGTATALAAAAFYLFDRTPKPSTGASRSLVLLATLTPDGAAGGLLGYF